MIMKSIRTKIVVIITFIMIVVTLALGFTAIRRTNRILDEDSDRILSLTDMSLYEKDDLEHAGWYYIPVETGQPLWMDPYFNQNLWIDMISYIIPYYHEGHTVGVIGMDIDLSLLRNFVEDINLYESGRAYLVSKQGDIIFHFDYPEDVWSKDLTDNLMPFINSVLNNPVDEVRTLVGIDGIRRKILMKRLRNDMILGLNAPVDEINVPQKTLTRQLLIVSTLILVLAIVVCLSWIRTVTAPWNFLAGMRIYTETRWALTSEKTSIRSFWKPMRKKTGTNMRHIPTL